MPQFVPGMLVVHGAAQDGCHRRTWTWDLGSALALGLDLGMDVGAQDWAARMDTASQATQGV